LSNWRAANIKPDSNAIALDLARLLQVQGEFTRAHEYLDRVIQNKATTDAERRRAAALLAQQGDSDRALKLLQEKSAQGSQEPDIVLAALYRQRNQLDKAEAIVRKLMEKPTAGVIQFAADLYTSQGKL
jgi:tetratricopeptide (TPR) repeat protein